MKLHIFIFITYAGMSFTGARDAQHETVFTEIVKGAYVREVPDIVLYNSIVPLTFRISLPKVARVNYTQPCYAKAFLCQLRDLAVQFHKSQVEDVAKNHPYLGKTLDIGDLDLVSRRKRGLLNVVGDIDKFLFGLATVSDVDELHVGINKLVDHETQLENAYSVTQRTLMKAMQTINAFSSNVSQEINRVVSAISDIEINKQKSEAALAQTIQSIIDNQYLSLLTRTINDAASDCRNHIIPRSVMQDGVLIQQLTALKIKLKQHHFVVAASLSKLMKLEIVDCQFTSEILQVIIHVPVKRAFTELKLFGIHHVPFQFGHSQCHLYDDSTHFAIVNKTVVPIGNFMQKYCRIYEDNLCLIKDVVAESSPFTGCLTSIYEKNSTSIREECPMKCVQSNKVRVTQILPGVIAVTNAETISMNCGGVQKHYKVAPGIGSIKVNIKCGCETIINSFQSIPPPFPCPSRNDAEPTVTQIIPLHFANIQGMVFRSGAEIVFENVSSILNSNWNYELPVLNLTTPKKIRFSQEYLTAKVTEHLESSSFLIYSWLTILTLFVGLIVFSALFHSRSSFSII